MARVAVRSLVKRFGRVIAVDSVSFEVADGEFMVLLGPSGCGKTTTLRLIAGLEKPDRGEIYIDGQLVNDIPPKDRDVAMVFQNYALYPHMKVYDNLAFPLKIRQQPRQEIDRRVREVARILKIEDLLDRYPRQLSGGQQQRIALGRALVREPKVFLMDEPLSNLDAKLRVYMRTEIKKLQRELKITTVYVTHDQAEAMTMADRVAVMNGGRILQIANPLEIYRKPADIFVAGFIGSPAMNLLDASVKHVGDLIEIDTGYIRIRIPQAFSQALDELADRSEVLVGIRPEHIAIHRKPVEGGYDLEVIVIEPMGSETIVNLKHGDSIVKARVPGHLELEPGERVHISFKLDEIHVFDKGSGKAII